VEGTKNFGVCISKKLSSLDDWSSDSESESSAVVAESSNEKV